MFFKEAWLHNHHEANHDIGEPDLRKLTVDWVGRFDHF